MESDISSILYSCGREFHQFKGKVWYGNKVYARFMGTHFYKKKVIFNQFNAVELSKWLFRAFINKVNEILPKEKYNKIFRLHHDS